MKMMNAYQRYLLSGFRKTASLALVIASIPLIFVGFSVGSSEINNVILGQFFSYYTHPKMNSLILFSVFFMVATIMAKTRSPRYSRIFSMLAPGALLLPAAIASQRIYGMHDGAVSSLISLGLLTASLGLIVLSSEALCMRAAGSTKSRLTELVPVSSLTLCALLVSTVAFLFSKQIFMVVGIPLSIDGGGASISFGYALPLIGSLMLIDLTRKLIEQHAIREISVGQAPVASQRIGA